VSDKKFKGFDSTSCKHVDMEDASCKINKGCGSGGAYCRPIWTDTHCYSLEKPNNTQLAEFGRRIYAHNDTIVCRQEDGKCWQLTVGDYQGVIPEEELIFIKKALLSD